MLYKRRLIIEIDAESHLGLSLIHLVSSNSFDHFLMFTTRENEELATKKPYTECGVNSSLRE